MSRPANTTGDALGTDAQRLAILLVLGRRCPICNKPMCLGCTNRRSALTIDHVQAWSTGGSNGAGNLLPMCGSCNSSKGAREIAAWLPGRLISTGRASTMRGAARMIGRELTKLQSIVAEYAAILEAN